MEPEIHTTPIRFYEIDLLRFLAAIAVVFHHYTWFVSAGNNHINNIAFPSLAPITKYGSLGVQLFFIISGYVVLMSAQGKTLKQFFLSRVTRLYPAFWVACTLTFVVERVWEPASSEPTYHMVALQVRDYLANLTMLQHFTGHRNIDGGYWTLAIEIGFYFLISILIGWKLLPNLPLICAGWLLYIASVGPTPSPEPALFSLLICQYGPYFIAGMMFYLIQTKRGKPWQLYGLLAFSYLLVLRHARADSASLTMLLHEHFSFVVEAIVCTSFFLVFYLVITRVINLQRFSWLSKLGALTYPLYLVHGLIGYIVFQHFGGLLNKYLLVLLLLIGMLLLAQLIHIFIEKEYSKPLGRQVNKLLESLSNF
jgi:peptidoglycan/LPS O-acetylase OafA/YrhL